jgi:hypothetical protein
MGESITVSIMASTMTAIKINTEEGTTEESTMEESTTGEGTMEESTTEEGTMEESTTEEDTTGERTTEEDTTEESTTEEGITAAVGTMVITRAKARRKVQLEIVRIGIFIFMKTYLL